MDENLKFGSMPTQPLGSSTVFHAGVIGAGKRSAPESPAIAADVVELNQLALVCTIFKVCHTGGRERSKEACRQLALMLVEMVTPGKF